MISQVKFFKDTVPLNWLLSEAVRVFHDSFFYPEKMQGPVFRNFRNFSGQFGATIPVISSQRQGSKPPNFAIFYVFSYIKNMLKISF